MTFLVVVLMVLSFLLGKSYGTSTNHILYQMFISDIYHRLSTDAQKEVRDTVKNIRNGLQV